MAVKTTIDLMRNSDLGRELKTAIERSKRLRKSDVDFEEALHGWESALRDGERWGNYYSRKRAGWPSLVKQRQATIERAKTLGKHIDKFVFGPRTDDAEKIAARLGLLCVLINTLGRKPETDEKLIAFLSEVRDALFVDLPQRLRAENPARRPSNDWLLSFLWSLTRDWQDMTGLAADHRGVFPNVATESLRFLRQEHRRAAQKEWAGEKLSGAALNEGKRALEIQLRKFNVPDDWKSVLATCRARFQHERPGDDLICAGRSVCS
jgi:hypothetical protein